MLRLVLQSGWAAPLSHWHRPGKTRTHLIQTSVSLVPCCNGSLKIHGLLVGSHKAVGSGRFSCLSGPRSCPLMWRSFVSWQSPVTGAWVRLSPGSGSCCHPHTRYLAVPLKCTTPHCCCSPQPSWLTHPVWLILSPEYPPDVSPVASDVENHIITWFFSSCIIEFVLLCAAYGRKWYTNPSSYCELCCTCHDLPPHPHFLLSHTVFLLLLEQPSRPEPVCF